MFRRPNVNLKTTVWYSPPVIQKAKGSVAGPVLKQSDIVRVRTPTNQWWRFASIEPTGQMVVSFKPSSRSSQWSDEFRGHLMGGWASSGPDRIRGLGFAPGRCTTFWTDGIIPGVGDHAVWFHSVELYINGERIFLTRALDDVAPDLHQTR